MKRFTAFVALTLVLAACGNDDAQPATTTTTVATTTSSTTTTTTEPTTTTTSPAHTGAVVVYILDPSGSNGFRQGPFLYPISVSALGGQDEAEAVLVTLFGLEGFDTAVPAGSTLDALNLDGSTAVVDLSEEFAGGGGSLSVMARLAQVVFSLTALDGIDDVLLVEDGDPVEVFSAEGLVLDGPLARADFEDLVPGILVDVPAAGAVVDSPVVISGVAAAFEGVFQLQILEGNDVIFEPPFVSTGSGVGFGEFDLVADIEAPAGTVLTIRVWEFSAEDGSVISERFVPFTIGG